jgi:hypothetical protein
LDDDTAPAEEDAAESSEDEKKQKKAAKKKATVEDNAHCGINFVTNTPYKLFEGESDLIWAEAEFRDPQPPVPTSRKVQTVAGDYILIAGDDVVLQKTSRGKPVQVSFQPEDEFILTADWSQFDEEMTGQDLVALGEETFLLWWQNVKPPKEPRKKIPRKVSAKTKNKR